MDKNKSDIEQTTSITNSGGVPRDYFTYHFSYALPNYIKTRPDHLKSVAEFFNIVNLAKTLFTPYRRIISTTKTTLTDRISFNILSSIIGAIVRLILIAAGIIILAIFLVIDYISIIFYVIPIFSLPGYLEKKQATFFEDELQDPQKFLAKISTSTYFQVISQFFDADFKKFFQNMPSPKTLGITNTQNPTQIMGLLATNLPELKTYLEKESIDQKSFESFLEYIKSYLENPPKVKITPIGQLLSFGYTNTLDQFGEELTIKALPHHMVKTKLLEKIEEILNRPQSNNVLLVGEAGVGRHSTLEGLASAISKYELPKLRDRRLILLDTNALLGSSANIIEIKANLENLLLEAKHAGNIILAIDQIDKISSSADNHIDLSEVITASLNDNSIPIVGITSTDDYNKYIRPNSEMTSLFEKLDIEESDNLETLSILIGKSLDSFRRQKAMPTLAALLEIIDKSNQIPDDRHQPEKSIIILEDAIANAKKNNKNTVDVATVDNTLAEISKIPIGKIKESEKEKLKDLEGFLHKRIVGQDEAITEIAKAMRRARSGIEVSRKTMGSFLFLGPTGVGKTETAKALSSAYFGQESKMIRLDMTEFQGNDALARLIGNPQTQSPGQLASLVRQNPYGVLLLDEFEKSGNDVQNLFLQIIDEGHLTDAFGKKVAFTNIITVATSNAGAEYIREEVERETESSSMIVKTQNSTSSSQNREPLTAKLIEYVLSKGLFSPELLNRFDAVVVYKPLTPKEVTSVAKLMLTQLAQDIKETKNITLEITDNLAAAVTQKGYDPAFGARPIKRLIADKIEDQIAKLVISDAIKNGDTISSEDITKFLS